MTFTTECIECVHGNHTACTGVVTKLDGTPLTTKSGTPIECDCADEAHDKPADLNWSPDA